jgi:hypothetical protein
MFQQTIEDVLTLAEAGPRPQDVLERLRATLSALERFESGEILAETPGGILRFVIAPGLGQEGAAILDSLGDQATFRVDTPASLLALRLEAPGATRAAIVLVHSRPWSFPAAPLSRIRTLGNLAVRLVPRSSAAPAAAGEVESLQAEVARLRAKTATLEDEIAALRADRGSTKGSGKPR